jgi:hypothetical protein
MPGSKRYTKEELREIASRHKSSEEPKWTCANCERKFYTRSALVAHQKAEARGEPYAR